MTIHFRNEGLMDIRAISQFGVSIKDTTNPIGHFGTGLKYAIAVLLRNECSIRLDIGLDEYHFGLKDAEFRGKPIQVVTMNGAELPFTSELGKHWELWMAYRELMANAMDEGNPLVTTDYLEYSQATTTWSISGPNEWEELFHEQLYLDWKPFLELDGLNVHDSGGTSTWLYVNGFRAYKLAKPALYAYNITDNIHLTEDRTIASLSEVHIIMARAISKSTNPEFIRQLLCATGDQFESSLDYLWYTIKSEDCFNKVVSDLISTDDPFNPTARSLYIRNQGPILPNVIPSESVPMDMKYELWTALDFWLKLGIDIPEDNVLITTDNKCSYMGDNIYISTRALDYPPNVLAGLILKYYAMTQPVEHEDQEYDLVLETLIRLGTEAINVSGTRKAS